MVRPVYSFPLWRDVNISGTTTLGPTVPAGFVWDVRDIEVFTTYGEWVSNPPPVFKLTTGSPIAIVGSDPFDSSSPRNHWDGRVILEEGDQIEAVVLGNNWSWVISGYELTSP